MPHSHPIFSIIKQLFPTKSSEVTRWQIHGEFSRYSQQQSMEAAIIKGQNFETCTVLLILNHYFISTPVVLGSLSLLHCFPSAAQVACEAVYYAVYVRRLRPEDQDVLVEFPRVEKVVQRVSKVRPPQGFALSQARQQARKVHMLHTMLKVGGNQSSETVHQSAVGLVVLMALCLIFRISWFTCSSCWWFCSSTTRTPTRTRTA